MNKLILSAIMALAFSSLAFAQSGYIFPLKASTMDGSIEVVRAMNVENKSKHDSSFEVFDGDLLVSSGMTTLSGEAFSMALHSGSLLKLSKQLATSTTVYIHPLTGFFQFKAEPEKSVAIMVKNVLVEAANAEFSVLIDRKEDWLLVVHTGEVQVQLNESQTKVITGRIQSWLNGNLAEDYPLEILRAKAPELMKSSFLSQSPAISFTVKELAGKEALSDKEEISLDELKKSEEEEKQEQEITLERWNAMYKVYHDTSLHLLRSLLEQQARERYKP